MLEKVINNQTEIVNTIKLLLYKENPSLLEKIDFEDDNVFLEPLLFAYFNSKTTGLFPEATLAQIMQGYFLETETVKTSLLFNENEVAYVPKKGYFKTGEEEPFAKPEIIPNTDFEAITSKVMLLKNLFLDEEGLQIPENEIAVEGLYEKHKVDLAHAFDIIREYSPEQYRLIAQCCKNIFLFETAPENGNSFATINAHGIAFFNIYQEDYDEVFFVDDIAHQTGHIILTTLFYDRKAYFKTDENQNIGEILKTNDHRNFYTLFHALYTYYTTFTCLDNALKNNAFNERQQTEAVARIGFYLNKCAFDLKNFEDFIQKNNGIGQTLTDEGIYLYNQIKDCFEHIAAKWHPLTSKLHYNNQSYNFSFAIFVGNNPIYS